MQASRLKILYSLPQVITTKTKSAIDQTWEKYSGGLDCHGSSIHVIKSGSK